VGESQTITITVKNRLGLHARPAMALADLASGYACEVTIERHNEPATRVNAKSIMEMMMLAATQGTKLLVTASGDGADSCLEAIAEFADRGFDEK